MRLSRRFRWGFYAAFGTLLTSGCIWLALDQLALAPEARTWLLMVHGGTAMLALLLLGALGPIHVRAAWGRGTNRATGIAMLALNGVLIATAFGLYYVGSEVVRNWTSVLHIGLGLGLPAVLLAHVARGRAARTRCAGR